MLRKEYPTIATHMAMRCSQGVAGYCGELILPDLLEYC